MATNFVSIPRRHLLVQSQQQKRQNNVWNLFRVDNKNTKISSSYLYSSVFIALCKEISHTVVFYRKNNKKSILRNLEKDFVSISVFGIIWRWPRGGAGRLNSFGNSFGTQAVYGKSFFLAILQLTYLNSYVYMLCCFLFHINILDI